MYPHLLATHSLLRWIFLIIILVTIAKSLAGWLGKKQYNSVDNKLRLFTVIAAHLQLVIGLVLYFVSPITKAFSGDFKGSMKIQELRFFGMEHALIMIVAIVLITIGSAKSKRATSNLAKFKTIAIWFTIAIILILASIPWEFSGVARPYLRAF